MRRFTPFLAALAVATLAPLGVPAQEPAPPATDKPAAAEAAKPRHPVWVDHLIAPKVLEKLKLTAAQKAKYTELDTAYRKEAAAWAAKHDPATARADFQKAKKAGDQDAMKKLRDARQEIRKTRRGYLDRLADSLNDDQTKIVDQAEDGMFVERGAPQEKGAKDKDE